MSFFLKRLLSAMLLSPALWFFLFPVSADASGVESINGKTVITVRVFGLPDPSAAGIKDQADVAAVRLFRKRFPEIFAQRYRDRYRSDPEQYGSYDWDNVEIRLVPFSGIQVEGVETDLLAIAGGLAPDVLYINFRKSDNYIRNRFLYPLDEYFETMTREEIDFRVHSKLWPVIRRPGPDGEEHIWAMPYGGALGRVLLYRKDLFEENDISFPDNSWTWDDMLVAAKKITDPARGRYGLMLGRGKHESWFWITFLWSAGAEAMVYDSESGQWRCDFDSRQAAKALDFYTRLSAERWLDDEGNIRRGYADKDSSERQVKWERGEIGMRFAYVDEKLLATINPDLVGMVPVPLGPKLPEELAVKFDAEGLLWDGRTRGAELNSRMMGLFSEIKHPAVRDAAWEYIRFYDGEEAGAIKTRIMVEGGLGRFLNPANLRRFGYPEFERLSPPGWMDTFDLAIRSGKPEPYGKNSNVLYDELTQPMNRAESMLLGDELPEDEEERLDVLQGLLREANTRANEVMIGIIQPRERTLRRTLAGLMIVLIATAFFFVFRKIMRTFSPPQNEVSGQARAKWDFFRYRWAYMLLLPAALTILFWHYIPLLRGSVMAFQDYKLIGESSWVWLDNFGDVLFSRYWWMSVWNSLRYSFLIISLTFMPPIILAILLQEVPKGKLIFRVIYYLPAVVTGLVTTLLWKQFYEPSESGALNFMMLHIPAVGFFIIGLILLVISALFVRRFYFHQMWPGVWISILVGLALTATACAPAMAIIFPRGVNFLEALAKFPANLFAFLPEPYRWLSDSRTAMLACVIPMVWAGMGPGCLIYLAALKGIPEDFYEASDIDGATFIDKIMFVIFPNLKMLIIINFIGVFIASWYGATGTIIAMTGGGSNTEVAGLHIWYSAFTYLRFGPATAMAWMLGFMMIGFTVNQLRMLSRVEFRRAGVTAK